MRTYGETYQERTWKREAFKQGDALTKKIEQEKKLRKTLVEIIKAFSDDYEVQKKILQVVYEQGHDGHLLKRIKNTMRQKEDITNAIH